MLKSFCLSRKNIFYYDIEKQTIARFPTMSNLKNKGSDNSLYFGTLNTNELIEIFTSFFRVSSIQNIKGLNYDFTCGFETVNVVININLEGQIQIKLMKDGTMGRLAENNAFDNMIVRDYTRMLLVVDFANKQIRFKDPNELSL